MCAMIQRSIGLENALLGFLNQNPQHGYQLHQRLSDLSGLGLVWRIKQSHLYAILDKFEKLKLVTSSFHDDVTYPPKKVFSLTEEGRCLYETWVHTPVKRPHLMRQEFMAKLFFVMSDDLTSIQTLLECQRDECQKWLLILEKDNQAENERRSFSTLVKSFRIGQVRAILVWLEKLMADSIE